MRTLAILCSDLHLTLQQPACRADTEWMGLQEHYLGWLRETAKGIPVICAGDIFDRWNIVPELINFALEHLPDGMICVPGQHDLPNHSLQQVHRSGYGVLAKAGKIIDLSDGAPYSNGHFVAHGFAWNAELRQRVPLKNNRLESLLHIAVIHKYMWLGDDSKYPGAPESSSFASCKSILKTYNAVVIGDNHKHWKTDYPGTAVMNCGTFIRRKSDEIPYRPRIGALKEDGSIEQIHVPTNLDRFHEKPKEREEVAFNMSDFINGLEELGEHGMNFRAVVEKHLQTEDIDQRTKEIILRAMDTDNKPA